MPRVVATTGLRTPAKRPPPLQARRPSRWRLLWRKRRRLVWPGMMLLALVLLVDLGTMLVHQLRGRDTVATLNERLGLGAGLKVREIRIEGRQKTPEDFLRAALGVHVGDRLLGLSLEAARARIEKLTWVQSATVARILPDTILVTLVERLPSAVWQNDHKFSLIDRAGQVVTSQDPAKDAEAFQKLPLVVGAGAPEQATALLDELDQIPALKARVRAAIRVGERRWTLHLNNNIDVLLPETGEVAALQLLGKLQAEDDLLDRNLQVIDLRLPDRMVLRPVSDDRQEAAAGKPGHKSP